MSAIHDNVRDALTTIGATGWIADLTDGQPNTRKRIGMYVRFVDESAKSETAYHGARANVLADYKRARSALVAMLNEATS